MVHGRLLDRGGVDHQVVGWMVEHLVGAHQEVLQGLGQALINLRGRILKSRFVPLGQDPGFEGETGRVRSDGQEAVAVGNDAHSGLGLLPYDVTKNAALFVYVILLRAFQFLGDILGNNRQRDQLPMGMLQRRPCRYPMVLEDQDVLEATVLLQIDDAVAVGPQDIFNALLRNGGQGSVVVGRFDNDLVRPNPAHLVEHAFGLTVQAAFDSEGGKLVRHHAYRPVRGVTRRPIWAIRQHFGRRLAFIAVAERAKAALQFHRLTAEVVRAFGAIGRNDYPSSQDWIFA